MKALFKIALLSFVLALGVRLADQGLHAYRNEKLTQDLCGVVGNFLETNSVRETYEGLSQALVKSNRQDVCVGVISSGKSYAPDCIDPSLSYQTTVCRADGNKSIRAEIRYPISTVFSTDLPWLTLCVSAAIFLALQSLQAFTALLSRKISAELESRLSLRQQVGRGSDIITKCIDWFFDRLGIATTIRRKTADLEGQLEKFELQVREGAAFRARKEAEAENAAEYIEKVRQIRHDIRSPLSSLFALKDVVEGDDLARQTLASAIKRIEAMVDDLSKVDKGETTPVLTIAEVLAEEAVATHRKKFLQGKGVSLSLEYGENLSPVLTVPGDFRRILDNLLENAFDAASAGGMIRVLIARDAKVCHISVEDNGAGIRAENLSRLFTKGGTFGKVNGLGLGLFHARHALEAWKGTIDCEPLAVGTRFTIALPLAQAGVCFVGLSALGDTLSVIDDDPSVARALAETGHTVLAAAATYAEGRQLLQAPGTKGATILVDYRLDGDQLGTDLIGSLPDRNRVILCTADFDNLELIRLARHLGVPILPKPLCRYAGRGRGKPALTARRQPTA